MNFIEQSGTQIFQIASRVTIVIARVHMSAGSYDYGVTTIDRSLHCYSRIKFGNMIDYEIKKTLHGSNGFRILDKFIFHQKKISN